MKSFTLSLLVAAAISLGGRGALAETSRAQGANAVLVSAAEHSNQAKWHAQNAATHRGNARKAEKNAADYMKIAESDAAHGFTYEAGVMRAKAAVQMAYARSQKELAAREEKLAEEERLIAKTQMASYQKTLGSSPAPHKPAESRMLGR